MADKIALEVAEAEFDRWAQAMGLTRKLTRAGMDADDKKSMLDQRSCLIEAMLDGHLVVDDDGQFILTPQKGDDVTPITFFEPDGAGLLEIDKVGKSGAQDVAKGYAILAAMTKQSRPRFAKR